MINHLRTLLLNRKAQGGDYAEPMGGEYIPPDYTPVPLSGGLQSVHKLLFGADPDWLYGNYRVQQYLAAIHATELAEYATALDSRITYDVRRPAFCDPTAYEPRATIPGVHILGEMDTPDLLGNAIRRWKVVVADNLTISVCRLTAPRSEYSCGQPPLARSRVSFRSTSFASTKFMTPSFLGGNLEWFSTTALTGELTSSFRAPAFISRPAVTGAPAFLGSDVSEIPETALVGEDVLISFPVEPGTFYVEAYVKPRSSLGEIAARLKSAKSSYYHDVFGVSQEEPMRTFRDLWLNHPELLYQLGGLLLAYVYRLEALRTNHA